MSNSSFVCPVNPLLYSSLGLCFAHRDLLQVNSAASSAPLPCLSTFPLREKNQLQMKKKSPWTNMVFPLDALLELEELTECIPIKCVRDAAGKWDVYGCFPAREWTRSGAHRASGCSCKLGLETEEGILGPGFASSTGMRAAGRGRWQC